MTMPWEEYQTPSTGAPWDEYRKPAPVAPVVDRKAIQKQVLAETPWLERQAVGAGGALTKAYLNAKGWLTGEEDKEGIQAAETAIEEAPVGAAGAELLATAIPGAGAYKAATMLPKIRKASEWGKRLVGGTAAGATGSTIMGGDIEDVGIAGAAGGAAEALLPPTAKAAWSGVKGGGRVARDLWQGTEAQASRYLRDVHGNKTDDVIAALRAAEPSIPGEQLTAGKAVGYQYPEMKVIQQRAENSPVVGPEFIDIDRANKAARMQPLDEMAYPGTQYLDDNGRMISEAEAAREQASKPLYARAAGGRVEMTPETQALVEGAEAQRAVGRGERGFQQEQMNAVAGGRNAPTGEIPAGAQTGGFDQWGMPKQEPFMPNYGSRSVEELQGIKKYLDSQISALARSGSDDDMMRRLSQARAQLNAQMEQQSGDYALANTTFRNFSAPQNQADVAAVLRGQMEQGPEQFLKGMADAPKTIQKADMSPRFGDLRQMMTPQQMDTLNALRSSAQREVDYAATPELEGMVPKAQSVMERFEQNLPTWFGQGITAARRALSRGGQTQDAEIRQIIGEAARDPKAMAELMAKIPKAEQGAVSKMLQNPRLLEALGPMRGAAIGYSAGQAQD